MFKPKPAAHINSNINHHPVIRGGVVGTINPPSNPYQIVFQNNYAFIADFSFGLRIVDISNPSSPTLVGSCATETLRNQAVAVKGNYAYIGNWNSGRIYIIDISNKINPAIVNTVIFTSLPYTEFAISGNYLFASTGLLNFGLKVFDISNPTVPSLVGSYSTTASVQGMAISGNYAYLAVEGTGLTILSISNPLSPTLAGSISLTDAYGVVVDGNYAYVAAPAVGLQIINIANPATPMLTASYSSSGSYRVAKIGNYAALTGNNGRFIDVSVPSNPVLASNSGLGSGFAIAHNGNYVYGGAFRVLKVLPAPVLGNNQLTINEGQTLTITTADINASDADDGNSITFMVSNVVAGRFELSTNPGVAISTFTKQQIINGVVRFVHNGGEIAPSYNIIVSDGLIFTQAEAGTINYTPVNDPPVLSSASTGALSYTEDAAAIIINPSLLITDADNANLSSATVTIVGYVSGEDVLSLPTNPQNGIMASFNTLNGTLTLSGTSSLANYQAALRTVTYKNNSQNPATSARSINIRVNDGIANSNDLSRSLSVIAVNDAPVLSSSSTEPLIFTEKEVPIAVNPTLVITDPDSASLVSAKVTISGYAAGEDVLSLPINPQNGIFATFNETLGELTLSGLSSRANYQAALQTVTYQDISKNPSIATRNISISVNDGFIDSAEISRQLTVVAVNDAPRVLSPIKDRTVTVGQPFQITVNNDTFIDPDNSFDELELSMEMANGTGLPDGLVFIPQNRTLAGTLSTEESIALRLSATDPQNASANTNFTLTSKFNLGTGDVSSASSLTNIFTDERYPPPYSTATGAMLAGAISIIAASVAGFFSSGSRKASVNNEEHHSKQTTNTKMTVSQ